jgi:hypothetical protein
MIADWLGCVDDAAIISLNQVEYQKPPRSRPGAATAQTDDFGDAKYDAAAEQGALPERDDRRADARHRVGEVRVVEERDASRRFGDRAQALTPRRDDLRPDLRVDTAVIRLRSMFRPCRKPPWSIQRTSG